MNHLMGDDESLLSSDEDFISNHVEEGGVHFHLLGRTGQRDLNPVAADSSESDTENAADTEASGPVIKKKNYQKRVESYSTTV